MRSGNHKGFQLSEATPVKRERHEFQFDSAHTSSGKGDAAFQLYCQQNLSPINNFGFGKAAFLHSPALQQSKNFGKSKSVFSPGFHHAHSSKYHQIPHHHQQQQYPSAQPNRAASVDQYPILSKDEFDVDYQQHLLKGAGTPLGGHKFHATPVPGRIFPYQNHIMPQSKSLAKDREKNGAPQDYIFQSPVFKISFNGREQLDLFLESGANDKDQIEHISFVGSSNKVVLSKQPQIEYENSQNSYQRVIQFNDENEDQQEQGQQDDDHDEGEDNNQEVISSERQCSRDHKPLSTKGVIQRNLLGNVSEESGRMKSLNLFEEAPSQLGAYDSQMTFNPYGNYHDSSTTTVKKPINEASQQISSQHDLRLTATKSNGNQKRKLFASPSFKDDRDLHTPSTKKKKAPSSALHIAGALSNACQTSSFINQEEKSQDKVITTEKQKQEDDENQEDKQPPAPFTLQATSLSAVKPCEEKKICCNCKRTKCLKLYCECFAASRVCEGCSCQGCFNKPEFEHMRKEARNSIIERNKTAFDPKIEAGKTQTQEAEEGNLESDQKAHSKGCNCKKSNCLKKYCECFQLGVKCSKLCKCESCKNTTSATYSDDGEYQMSASAIKSSARKQHAHGSMNEYSQYNQFNYFHPDPYYPYYYPTYPYGAYPFFGDYYMCHPEDAEKHQGNHIDTYPYDQLQHKGLSKSNKKYMMQQQLMIMNGKKGLVKGKIQAEDGLYAHFPAPPLDKKRKIMETKEDNDEMSSEREEEEENNVENKSSEEQQMDEKEEKNCKQKGKENNNNTCQEEIQEEKETKSKTSIKEEVRIDNEAEKSLIKTKQTKNLENQSKIIIEEQEQNDLLNTDSMKEEMACQEKGNEENGQIKGKKQIEEKQGSNSKSKKIIDLPKRELSKRGSGQKEVTHSILTRRSQESNKKKKTQQQIDQSDESGQEEEGQEEQPQQAEMNQGSAQKEENRIITRHLEEKTKQAVSSNSRSRRNK